MKIPKIPKTERAITRKALLRGRSKAKMGWRKLHEGVTRHSLVLKHRWSMDSAEKPYSHGFQRSFWHLVDPMKWEECQKHPKKERWDQCSYRSKF